MTKDGNNWPAYKTDELAILDTTIAQLGPYSYLGPWLTQVRAEAESLLTSDIRPEISLTATENYCTELRDNARKYAEETGATARKEAGKLINEARKTRLDILHHAARQLRAALSTLPPE